MRLRAVFSQQIPGSIMRESPLMYWPVLFALGILAFLNGISLLAQQPTAQQSATPTLHVYTNLVQIPVLALNSDGGKISVPNAQNRFSISIDNGPWHRPSLAHLEADDPIDLSIVLDAQAMPNSMVERMDTTIAGLAPSFLHPHDHVSVYVMACSRLNYVENVPAQAEQLTRTIDAALMTWTAQRQKVKAPCNRDGRIWDVLAFTIGRLSPRTGRRAILAFTDGHDRHSRTSLAAMASASQKAGVTLFSFDPSWSGSPGRVPIDDTILSYACELTGGVLLNRPLNGARSMMQSFIQMLRDRYILEFPRPPDLQAGQNTISVKIDKVDAFIRVSGNSIPLPGGARRAGADQGGLGQPIAPVAGNAPADSADAASLPARPDSTMAAAAEPAVVPGAQPPQAAAVAASQPPSGSSVPTLKVATKLTVEDVTVSDEHRRPVHGLQRSDFSVKEDGKPQEIRDFEEYGSSRPQPQPAPPQLPPNTYTNMQPAPTNTSAIDVLLLDNTTTGIGGRSQLANIAYPKQQAMNYLKKIPPGTQVAILKLENGLHLVQGVTTDKEVLLAAMNTISFKLLPGSSASPPSGLSEACARANSQSRLVLDAMGQQAAYLSGIPGRKNLIWFMPGIPWLTNYPAFSRVPCLVDYTPQLHRAYGLLNAAHIALYPVDPRGIVSDSLGVTAKLRNQGGSAIAIGGSSFVPHASLDTDHASLQDMAIATGGAAFFNRNDLDGAIEEAVTSGADYYSLAYVPPLSKYDGQYHTIEVKADRPHLTLHYRPGYNSIDLAKQADPATQSPTNSMPQPAGAFDIAMAHGAAPSTQLLFDVAVTRAPPTKPGDPLVIGTLNPTLKGKSLVRYDARFTLSADQIALTDGPDGARMASVNLVIAAYDAEGKMLDSVGQATQWTLKPDQVAQFTQQSLPIQMQVDLPSGNVFVRFGLFDPASQKVGTLEIPETVSR